MKAVIVAIAIALTGCALLQPGAEQLGTVDAIIADAMTAARAPSAEQKAALSSAQDAFTRDPTAVNRLRLATLLAVLPAPLRDDARAAELFEPLADAAAPGFGRFAALFSALVVERQRLTREFERAERKRRSALLPPAGLRDGDLEVQGHGARTEADEQQPEADGHGMVERRHQADRSRHAGPAQHRPQSLRSRAYEARSDQPGGYRAESAQREQDAGRPLAVAEVCEQQGVERDGERRRQRREVGAKHRILDDPLMEQAPVADQQARAADGRLLRGRLGAETGTKGHQPSACQGEECGLEPRCGKEKSTQRSAGDLAYVGRGVEASQLDAALPRQLARQRPGRRPERGPRQDQGELAEHQHP